MNTLVVCLELACLEERNGVPDETEGCQLGEDVVVIELLLTCLDAFAQLMDPPLDLVSRHEH